MTGRHAGTSHDSLFWGVARLAGATTLVVVVVAAPLALIALGIYFVATGSDLTSSSIVWAIWAAIVIATIIERDKKNRFFLSIAALLMIELTLQLAGALAAHHIWLAGHSRILFQISDRIKWIAIPLLVIRVVIAIRSGELRFRRRRPDAHHPEPRSPATTDCRPSAAPDGEPAWIRKR